jgi:hypothetical protein
MGLLRILRRRWVPEIFTRNRSTSAHAKLCSLCHNYTVTDTVGKRIGKMMEREKGREKSEVNQIKS